MIDLDTVDHHPAIEELTDILCNRTQNYDRKYFRVIVAYYLGVMAASMRAEVVTHDRGNVPVNCYVLALSPSGSGKGYSTGIMENEVLKAFKKTFVDMTMPLQAEQALWKRAARRAGTSGNREEEEMQALEREYAEAGAYLFTFDSGTTPAIKQYRHKLLLAQAGAINFQVDEIGSNLIKSTDLLDTYLELFDQGRIKPKLIKNTAENKRVKEIEGKTPANMLLFGTPTKLFDGSSVEANFYSLLQTGYARRCLFAAGQPQKAKASEESAAVIYDRLTDPKNKQNIQKWANHFAQLADPTNFGWLVEVQRDEGIALLEYKLACEAKADALPEHEEVSKTELTHRYFNVLKFAGALAFIDGASTMTMYHLHAAMKLIEDSGSAFQATLTKDRTYMKLARYIAECKDEVTHADLDEALPYYKSGTAARNEMMTMATAWGYKHHIVIKKNFVDGIEFFSGETLAKTDLDRIQLSYSEDFAYNYQAEEVPFDKLHLLTQEAGFHWATHAFKQGHRCEENVIPGFNLVAIDVDGGTKLEMVHELLKDYTFMTYTTKRHTPDEHRFRLIMPMNYQLHLEKEDFKAFMQNLGQWLPFDMDESTFQRSRKWQSCETGTYHYNVTDTLLDILPFVPKTARNKEFQDANSELQSLDSLERWFAQRISDGNRNNLILKYALALVDSGMSYAEVENHVMAFNDKLGNGLPPEELRKTVLVTVARKVHGTP